ncbi:hypothetical protein BH23BAC1_BH23BAC1_48790 [soil metagenome]
MEPIHQTIKKKRDRHSKVYCPFGLTIDPMERLLLINIEKDPDLIYLGFEPQVFNDPINGKGLLVLGWRVDGRVDLYHQPTLTLNPLKYDIAGKGLAHMVERPFNGAYFQVNEQGVQAFFEFEDLEGRHIEVKISEQNTKKRKPFGLLAPMGDAAENPSAMPLVLVHDFYFIRRKKTEISVKINGKSHLPDNFPIPLDGSWMFFTRYSSDPFIVTLNPAFDGVLPALFLAGPGKATLGETLFELENAGSSGKIKSLSRSYKHHTIKLSFEPAFPNIAALKKNQLAEGQFVIQGHQSTGCIKGHYQVQNKSDQIQVVMIPSGGWIPNEKKLSIRFLYFVAKIFRNWPKTYSWEASINEDNGQLYMKSFWKRIRNEK